MGRSRSSARRLRDERFDDLHDQLLSGAPLSRNAQGDPVVTYQLRYIHTDALGSPVLETNTAGEEIAGTRTLYEPFGAPLTTPREGAPSYTGHQFDSSTGLSYAQQRYYDPQLGVFYSPDPMAVDTHSAINFNRYAYANNSPYRFVDPDGREAGCITLNTGCGFGQVSQAEFNGRVSLAADFVPVVGDIKGIAEAIADPSLPNIAAAGVGLIPVVGDAAAKVIKGVDKLRDASVIYRQGDSAESVTRLGRKATEAENSNIGIHGVSGSTTKPSGQCSSATCGALENAGFKVHPTPTRADPNHVTIELPKPVKKPVADKLNEVLGRD